MSSPNERAWRIEHEGIRAGEIYRLSSLADRSKLVAEPLLAMPREQDTASKGRGFFFRERRLARSAKTERPRRTRPGLSNLPPLEETRCALGNHHF
jgi:hypothetical protein